MDVETRLHPRISADWDALIRTSEGPIEVRTKDISVGGACILYPSGYEFEERFPISLMPPGEKSVHVIAETVWSGKSDPENRMIFHMGVRFIAISPEDQEFIETLTKKRID